MTTTAELPRQLRVKIEREPFMDFFVLKLDNGHSEELEPEEIREWFRVRGANLDVIEKVLDEAWNWPPSYKDVYVVINNYKEPPQLNKAIQPRI